MPTDHAEVTLRDVRVPDDAIFGAEGEGLAVAQTFVHEMFGFAGPTRR